MIVLLHVVIALASMAWTTLLLFSPNKQKFYIGYALIGLTLLSGSYLVVSTHARLLQACVMGLTYLAIVAAGVLVAYWRLAKQEAAADKWRRYVSDKDDN